MRCQRPTCKQEDTLDKDAVHFGLRCYRCGDYYSVWGVPIKDPKAEPLASFFIPARPKDLANDKAKQDLAKLRKSIAVGMTYIAAPKITVSVGKYAYLVGVWSDGPYQDIALGRHTTPCAPGLCKDTSPGWLKPLVPRAKWMADRNLDIDDFDCCDACGSIRRKC